MGKWVGTLEDSPIAVKRQNGFEVATMAELLRVTPQHGRLPADVSFDQVFNVLSAHGWLMVEMDRQLMEDLKKKAIEFDDSTGSRHTGYSFEVTFTLRAPRSFMQNEWI